MALWTTLPAVVISSNMKAELLLQECRVLAEDAFVELVVWQVPSPGSGSTHGFKYRLALVVNGVCALRYDNEAGKGITGTWTERNPPTLSLRPRNCSPISGTTSTTGGPECIP